MSIVSSLRFVLAPLLVMALGLIVFERSGIDAASLCALATRPDGAGATALVWRESVMRLMWLGTVFGYVVTVAASGAVSIVVIRSSRGGASALWLVAVSVLAALLVAGTATTAALPGGAGEPGGCAGMGGSAVVDITVRLPAALLGDFYRSQGLAGPTLPVLGPVLHGLGAAGVTLVLLAASAAVSTPARGAGRPAAEAAARAGDQAAHDQAAGEQAASIAAQMRRVRWLLEAICIQFVVGILQMLTWLRLPASVAPDAATAGGLADLAWGVALYWGAVFSLSIAAYYVPVTQHLSRRATDALDRMPEKTRPPDPERWLRDRALSGSLAGQLPQTLVMLAPLLAAPIGNVLTNWMAPLGG